MIEAPVANITVIHPDRESIQYALTPKTYVLGRAADCDVPIRDKFLSRRHAEISYDSGAWRLRDCGSSNGTFLNGDRVASDQPLTAGDRITLGDSEVIFNGAQSKNSDIAVEDSAQLTNISLLFRDAVADDTHDRRDPNRLKILNALALELLEDRPMKDLFEFIVERVYNLLSPSRAALAILAADKQSFETVTVRRSGTEAEGQQLTISRTLLAEVVEGRRVVSFLDVAENEKLQKAHSIIGQSIRSALCAPLIVGESVVGVLYLDYLLARSNITEEEVRLVAQVARIAAMKLETTLLREASIAKQRMEEELKTAFVVQSRLLPEAPPVVAGYEFAGWNKPCQTVSGDYYDFVVREDGRIFFIIADVSGKGITAALVMAGLATAFEIFTRTSESAAQLVRDLNLTLTPKTSPSKFVTLFAAILDPATGDIQYANAGHVPPLFVGKSGVKALNQTDLVVGLFAHAAYRNQTVRLEPGESLLLFTDGVTECESPDGEELGGQGVLDFAESLFGDSATTILLKLDTLIGDYACHRPFGDDVTVMALSRNP